MADRISHLSADRLTERTFSWRLRRDTIRFECLPRLVGIVNVTPDSFSDGGAFLKPEAAIRHAIDLADQGADILDIGGESTRPYSDQVDVDEELRRVLPVVEAVCRAVDVPVSIDTTKASVARAALDVGAQVINDISGGLADPRMLPLAVDSGAGLCLMHIQGTPQTMQDNPTYLDVVQEVFNYLAMRRDEVLSVGVEHDRICLDPGIGFGKSNQHNIELLAQMDRFQDLLCPILVGHSRKAFIGKVLGDKVADRTAGTIGTALAMACQGVHLLRVHDVAVVRQALMLFEATGGLRQP